MKKQTEPFIRLASRRIVMFCDLRDSTNILENFEEGLYGWPEAEDEPAYTYEDFLMSVHRTSYHELYLGHEKTFSEIYGDGVLAVLPEDNTKYILENLHRLSQKMHDYNAREPDGHRQPRIDIGFGITVGAVTFVYYSLDERYHAVGRCIHEAARIENLSAFYQARVLITEGFFKFARIYLESDPRFSYRFIDKVVLKGLRRPLTLYELLIETDPRYELKKNSVDAYGEAYDRYRRQDWNGAKKAFQTLFEQTGLEVGMVMAERCDYLSRHPPGENWDGIWVTDFK